VADRALLTSGDAIEHRFLGGEAGPARSRWAGFRTWKHRLLSAWPLLRLALTVQRRGDHAVRDVLALERRLFAEDPASLPDAELGTRRRDVLAFMTDVFALHLQASGCAGAGYDAVSRLARPLLGDDTDGAVQ